MKRVIAAILATTALSACTGLAVQGGSADPSVRDSAQIRSYGFRDATRDYPYNPAGW